MDRADTLDRTAALADADPAVAVQVAAMRHAAALHGRVTGSAGAYYTEQLGHRPGAEELTVYVGQEEYADLLNDPETRYLGAAACDMPDGCGAGPGEPCEPGCPSRAYDLPA